MLRLSVMAQRVFDSKIGCALTLHSGVATALTGFSACLVSKF